MPKMADNNFGQKKPRNLDSLESLENGELPEKVISKNVSS